MLDVGRDDSLTLSDGRTLEYWDGGDPDGLPVVMHPGTPATRILGRWGHRPAVDAGVRLVSLNRPGYGGSTPVASAPSLLQTGRDTAYLAAQLGFNEYAALGISGGGPFAMATAVADPEAVRTLALVGPVGPWRILEERPPDDPEDHAYREYLAQLDDGDVVAARAGLQSLAEDEMSALRDLESDALVDAILGEPGSPLATNPEYRGLWVENMAVVLDCLDGYLFDNLAWGAIWDADPRNVVAPTAIWDGEGDGARYGKWYADQIEGSELVIFAGEGHLDVCDAHWPEVLATLLRMWK